MKKRWLPFSGMCLLIIFLLGQMTGSSTEAERQAAQQKVKENISRTIAVVNADTGHAIDNGRLNYSAAIIDTLGDNFVLVSSVMAYSGYANGTYAAVVTFPSDVSTKILSFNSNQPEKIQLEFQVNPNLPEQYYLETYVSILELQLSINTTLANTYVSSIYEQFHKAQNQVEGIFQNDIADLDALEIIQLTDFTADLELDLLPEIPFEPKGADTEQYMKEVTGFANSISNLYLNSYESASNQYLSMREGLFKLIDNFPHQEVQWLEQLDNWSSISVNYGESLERYSDAVRNHEDELMAWHTKNVEWNNALKTYQAEVTAWLNSLKKWFGEASDWYVKYQAYLAAASDYMDEVSAYRAKLAKASGDTASDLAAWKSQIEDEAEVLFNEIADSYTNYNSSLDDIRTDLEDYQDAIANLEGTITSYQQSIMDMSNDENATEELKNLLGNLDTELLGFIQNLKALNELGELDPGDPPSLNNFSQWNGQEFEFSEYTGETIPSTDELAEKFPEPGTVLPEKPSLEQPIDYLGVKEPTAVGEIFTMSIVQPGNPLVGPPPKPENFWYSLNLMQDQLSAFDVDKYLSDDVKKQVAVLLKSYEDYLDMVRDDLAFQFEGNIMKMQDVKTEYEDYLSELRLDAIAAEADQRENLQQTISTYSEVKLHNSEDTLDRLSDFAKMMPESRSPAGLNRNLVGFTVAPFDFAPPAMRPGIVIEESENQQTLHTYEKYLWVLVSVAGVMLLLICSSYLIVYIKGRKKEHD